MRREDIAFYRDKVKKYAANATAAAEKGFLFQRDFTKFIRPLLTASGSSC
jgi:hypothetical protein